MALVEPHFDPNQDRWRDLALNPETRRVELIPQHFERLGGASSWLRSEAFHEVWLPLTGIAGDAKICLSTWTQTTMKQFKSLTITGPDEQLGKLMDKISASAKSADGWRRDDPTRYRPDETELPCFSFTRNASEEDDLPSVQLFLTHKSGRLYVTNIVPGHGGNGGQLSESQYNQILDEFAEMVPTTSQLTLNITSDDANITDHISDEAARLLENFSRFANKFTGSAHPMDFERWAEFLIKVHEEGSSLSGDFLSNWLVEELEWPHEEADKLTTEYRFARDLLQAYGKAFQ